MATQGGTVEYKLTLRDLMEKGLKKNIELSGKLDNAMKHLSDQTKKTESVFGGMLKFNIFERLTSGATDFISFAIRSGVALEQTQIAFQTLTGDVETGMKLFGELREFANVTPFRTEQVTKAGRTLLSFGVAAEDVTPTLKVLGEISAGTGKDLSELGVIYGQIKGAGRLMGQDLLQLINAGFNPLQEISQHTGRSMSDLKKDMEKGNISFKMVQESFARAAGEGGIFNNMMINQSKTLGGLWSTFLGKATSLISDFALKTSGGLKSIVSAGIEFIDWIDRMSGTLKKIAILIGSVAAVWGIYAIAVNGATIAQYALNLAMSLNPVAAIIIGITALVGWLIYLMDTNEKVASTFYGMWEVIKQIGSNIATYFKDVFGPVIEGIRQISDGNLAAGGKLIGQGFVNQFRVDKLADGIADAWKRGTEKGVESVKRGKLKDVFDYETGSDRTFADVIAGSGGATNSAGEAGKESSTSVDGVKSGRPTSIYIDIEKLVESFNVNVTNAEDSASEIKELVAGALVSAVNDANLIGK